MMLPLLLPSTATGVNHITAEQMTYRVKNVGTTVNLVYVQCMMTIACVAIVLVY